MNRQHDAFSRFHPAVNALFFLAAIVFCVVLEHPAFLAVSALCAAGYTLFLKGRSGLRTILSLLPFCLLIAVLNPLFNHHGATALFSVFGKPYTLEALLCGLSVAGMFLTAILWFFCFGEVVTGDKLAALLGNLLPSLSLLLVMVLRLVPAYRKRAAQIGTARKSIGKATDASDRLPDRLRDGISVLSALTSWALEGSVMTADSMRSRGYGTARRTCFRPYRFSAADLLLSVFLAALTVFCIAALLSGCGGAVFFPRLLIPPLQGLTLAALLAYAVLLSAPLLLNLREVLVWRCLRSKI